MLKFILLIGIFYERCRFVGGHALSLRMRWKKFRSQLHEMLENRLTDSTSMLVNSAKALDLPQPWNAPKWLMPFYNDINFPC
jgi:hypothetical protein